MEYMKEHACLPVWDMSLRVRHHAASHTHQEDTTVLAGLLGFTGWDVVLPLREERKRATMRLVV